MIGGASGVLQLGHNWEIFCPERGDNADTDCCENYHRSREVILTSDWFIVGHKS